VDPKDLRDYLNERGCRLHRKHHSGIEVWRKPGLNKPIQFYNLGPVQAGELARITEALGVNLNDLGNWRKKQGV
jgi:hypothetical protein